MKYALLICDDETRDISMDEIAASPAFQAFERAAVEDGNRWGGARLRPVASATTVRVRDGETLVSDGPFAETKEMLGGYYIVDVPDRQTALAWAAKVPNAPYGSIEVRPVLETAG